MSYNSIVHIMVDVVACFTLSFCCNIHKCMICIQVNLDENHLTFRQSLKLYDKYPIAAHHLTCIHLSTNEHHSRKLST